MSKIVSLDVDIQKQIEKLLKAKQYRSYTHCVNTILRDKLQGDI